MNHEQQASAAIVKKTLLFFVCSTLVGFMSGCKGVSRFPIDERPITKMDSSFLGIWKAVEDTDKANYFFVQNEYDVHKNDPEYNARLLKNSRNYYISYVDHHGDNPHFYHWNAFLSDIKSARFLNIGDPNTSLHGYIFVKILNVNTAHDHIITAVVSDSTLKYLKSSADVKARIIKNVNNPLFYSDTLHFYKVSNYHESFQQSKTEANPR